jgi:phage-related minor tail protein
VLSKNKDEITLILSVLGKLLAFLTATALQVAFVALGAAITAIGTAFDIAVSAVAGFIEMIDKVIKKVEKLIDLVSGSSLGGMFKGLFDGARAEGGPVSGGKSYLVGEKGPEMFTPSQSGMIIPNKSLATQSAPALYITGNTFLSEDAAEQMGDMIMSRLKLSNAF